jgi:hypothetical protein
MKNPQIPEEQGCINHICTHIRTDKIGYIAKQPEVVVSPFAAVGYFEK